MNPNTKHKLLSKIKQSLDQKIASSLLEVESIKESKNNDTKSSAGDKFETGRAMAQQELDKQVKALQRLLKMKEMLLQIKMDKEYRKVEFGSLVYTNHGNYLMAIAYGQVQQEEEAFYVISLISPLAQAMLGKPTGEDFQFQDKEYSIQAIY